MTTYSPEMRERALRMLAEAAPDRPNRWTAIRHVAGLLGMSPETLRLWQRREVVDAGEQPGVTTSRRCVAPRSQRLGPGLLVAAIVRHTGTGTAPTSLAARL